MRRLFYFLKRSRFDNELSDEIQFHLETRAAELEAAGVPRADALLQARREFGSTAQMREGTHAAWQFRWIEDLASDLRYAARACRRSPGFTLAAVLSLALGIGANSTIFSLVKGVLLGDLGMHDPATLVSVHH